MVALFLCLMPALLLPQISLASTKPLFLVLAPDTSNQSSSVFNTILASMGDNRQAALKVVSVSRQTSKDDIEQAIHRQQYAAIIPLGQTAYKLTQQVNTEKPIIAGALNLVPDGVSGVSLTGAPQEFLEKLQHLAPSVKRVSIVYSERANGWWVKHAQAAAEERGLEFNAVAVDNLRQGVKAYKRLLDSSKGRKDAIWLPLVDIVPLKTVMPMLLKTAWEKNIVVFSNNPSHTKLGVLFSLYPDNNTMGDQIVDYALSVLENGAQGVVPANQLKSAINIRTARHLGIAIKEDELAHFDRVYPSK